MVKFLAGSDKETILGFGLSEENIKALKEGKPISIDLSEMGIKDTRAMIFYGETEEDMKKDLSAFINSETILHPTKPN